MCMTMQIVRTQGNWYRFMHIQEMKWFPITVAQRPMSWGVAPTASLLVKDAYHFRVWDFKKWKCLIRIIWWCIWTIKGLNELQCLSSEWFKPGVGIWPNVLNLGFTNTTAVRMMCHTNTTRVRKVSPRACPNGFFFIAKQGPQKCLPCLNLWKNVKV